MILTATSQNKQIFKKSISRTFGEMMIENWTRVINDEFMHITFITIYDTFKLGNANP